MDVYVVGTASTVFQRWPDRDFGNLADEVIRGALEDADIAPGQAVERAWFGNCAMGVWGQPNIRGQVALCGAIDAGLLPEGLPIINVEGGCATGALALHDAYQAVASGSVRVALAVGVEKTWVPHDPAKSFALFSGGIDQLHPERWQQFYREGAAAHGLAFEPHPARVLFLDVHALVARHHMKTYGTTVEQIAAIAAKNHHHGTLNPKAQFRFEVPVDKVLADKPVVAPLTRAMCAPISDGAAAAILCSAAWLEGQSAAVKARAVRLRACELAGGRYRDLGDPSVVQRAAALAYARAGVSARDIQVAEVHDATSACELIHYEALGFCGIGESGEYAVSGATALGGDRPVNLSGGLVSKGHPLGATGLGQIDELVLQLRGEAGDRQAPKHPRIALAQNAGGAIGWDEALCGVTILSRD